jgi:hypothetical protein
MAGDWIKMRMNLRTHPKVVRIASALKADKFRIVGGLHAVWSLADEHTEDGSLPGYTLAALDDSIGWPGFSAAMKNVEWLIEEPQRLVLPRFDEHNGASAKRRAQDAERKRNDRKTSAPDADTKRTREEKKREELTLTPSSPPSGKNGANGNGKHVERKKLATATPPEFVITEPMWSWARDQGLPDGRVEPETAKFLDHHRAKGTTFKDWDAAWRTWMRKAVEFSAARTH